MHIIENIEFHGVANQDELASGNHTIIFPREASAAALPLLLSTSIIGGKVYNSMVLSARLGLLPDRNSTLTDMHNYLVSNRSFLIILILFNSLYIELLEYDYFNWLGCAILL